MTISRRRFLEVAATTTAGVAGSLVLGDAATAAIASRHAQPRPLSGPPILVVIDLQGGNDALNTLIPQTGRYRDLRPSLQIPEDDLLTFFMLELGVHPSLASLEPLWNRRQLSFVYGAGLPGQGRSHFVAQDAWRTARPNAPVRSGWLGRWLELTPVPDAAPLRAIALGQSTLAATGVEDRPVSVQSLEGFRLVPPRDSDAFEAALRAAGQPLQPGLLGQAQQAIPETFAAIEELQSVLQQIPVDEADDDDDDVSRSLFAAIPAIIQAELGTQVIYVTVDGFDTHAIQAQRHAQLLQVVSDGIAQLYDELEKTGHSRQTLTLVVSEFGRRAAENGSAGTDHGRGGLSFLAGPAIRAAGVIDRPDLDDLIDGDLRITRDAREMYDSALRWLGATDEEVNQVLGGRWDSLPLLNLP